MTLMVACGDTHTLVMTAGGLWTCGAGLFGRLTHGDEPNKLLVTKVAAEYFNGNE